MSCTATLQQEGPGFDFGLGLVSALGRLSLRFACLAVLTCVPSTKKTKQYEDLQSRLLSKPGHE